MRQIVSRPQGLVTTAEYVASVGLLKRIRNAEDKMLLDARSAHPQVEWAQWAAANGWTYAPTAPELAGRFRQVATSGAERYDHLLTSMRHGLAVQVFEYSQLAYDAGAQREYGFVHEYVVIRLPGYPPRDLVAGGIERALRQLGGTVPHDAELSLIGTELVLQRQGHMRPEHVTSDVELLTRQISAAPSSLWQQNPG